MNPAHFRRRRPALSCIECRRRKVRCDRANPCRHCIAAKIACSYKPDPRTTKSSAMQQGLKESTTARPTETTVALSRHSHSDQSSPRISQPAREIHDYAHAFKLPTGIVSSRLSAPYQSDDADSLLSVELNPASNVSMKKTRVAGWSDRMGNDLVCTPSATSRWPLLT